MKSRIRSKKDALSARWYLASSIEKTASKIRDAPSPSQLKIALSKLLRELLRTRRVLDYWLKHHGATRKGGRYDLRHRPYGILHPRYRYYRTRENKQTRRL